MSENKPEQPAADAQPIAVSDDNFEDIVLNSDVPVVVDFWAQWCGPCRQLAPALEQLAREYAGRVRVAKVDVTSNQRWAKKLSVAGLPHLLYMHKGQIVDRKIGCLTQSKLQALFDQLLRQARRPGV